MKIFSKLAPILFGLFVASPAFAETWTVGGGSDLGIMLSSRSAEHNDMVATTSLVALMDYGVSSKTRLGFGIGIPMPAAASLSAPLSVRYFPFGWASSGIYVQAQVVPMWTLAAPCAFNGPMGPTCPIPGPDIDEGRLYRVLGAAGKVGAGFHLVFGSVWISLDGAFSQGYFHGLETDGYSVVSGIYTGAELGLAIRVELDP